MNPPMGEPAMPSPMTPIVDPALESYALDHSSPEAPHLSVLAAETHERTVAPQMMVGPLEGELLALLVALVKPRLVLEIGTFTGYSALSMAAELPSDGRIITCEIDEHHAEIAQRHIAASPYASRIEVRIGPAAETVAGIEGPLDLVFIDADKASYIDYYEAVMRKLAPEGVIAVDNVCWSGRVISPDDDPDTLAIRAFNDHVRDDERVEKVMLTVRDGVTIIRRRRAT